MNERGYVILASNQKEYRQAAALAYSIKAKMPKESVTLVVPDSKIIDNHWLEAIDSVVEFPFVTKEYTRQNDWQLYWASPYKYTIALDCKMLIKEDHTTLWDYLIDHHDICFSNEQRDFMGRPVESKLRRAINEEYPHIPKIGSSMFFFVKDTDAALQYFKYADVHVGHHTMLLNGGIIGYLLFVFFWIYFILTLISQKTRHSQSNLLKKSLLVFLVGIIGLLIIHSSSTTIFSYFIKVPNALMLTIFFVFADIVYKETKRQPQFEVNA